MMNDELTVYSCLTRLLACSYYKVLPDILIKYLRDTDFIKMI